MPAFYSSSDIFVMPSKATLDNFESFGIVFAEAGACGKPVIGGRSGGMSDAIVDGVTGLLVDPGNVEEVAEAILKLLQDRELARQMGERGRRRAVEDLSWERVTERLEQLLSGL